MRTFRLVLKDFKISAAKIKRGILFGFSLFSIQKMEQNAHFIHLMSSILDYKWRCPIRKGDYIRPTYFYYIVTGGQHTSP